MPGRSSTRNPRNVGDVAFGPIIQALVVGRFCQLLGLQSMEQGQLSAHLSGILKEYALHVDHAHILDEFPHSL